MTAHLAMLRRRLARLQRLVHYGEDGHGNQLSNQAIEMVYICIVSTALDIARMEVEA